ncbi:hypothetical protein D7S68_17375 [Ralstonia pickettii]|nr:hypothetical protein [Ralstonia pickettii]MBA9888358.1 hypothetical protein [Ralstonia pickettii]MBA9893166.1 hypothetical protein [Ralstonia pickettii]MBA9925404.1 hypothetical protein [Ralstonia pickettii]MBB0178347.1 hypothetical protein [Ralstonia pickettii]
MKSMAWQATPTPVLDLLPSLLTTKTNRPPLRRSLVMETSLAILILALVAWLGVLSPPGT